MPAAKLFLTSADISKVTGMSIRSAQNLMYYFAQNGQTIKCGKSSRGQMVSVSIFVKHLCTLDGADPVQRKRDVIRFLTASRNDD